MNNRNLNLAAPIQVISTGAAAGTTAVNCTAVDLYGYCGVRAICVLGALTATQVTYLKAQGSNTNNGSDWVDLGSTKTGPAADADSNKTLVLSLYKPAYRYIQFVVVRGTANAVVTSVVAELYTADREPGTLSYTSNSALNFVPYASSGTP